MTDICEESDYDFDNGKDDDYDELEGAAPTSKRRRIAWEEDLQQPLASELCPQFSECEGPFQFLDPNENDELAFVQLVWPTFLCELIGVQQNNHPIWVDISRDEVWIFLGIVVVMGIHRLPQIKVYWSMDSLIGVPFLSYIFSNGVATSFTFNLKFTPLPTIIFLALHKHHITDLQLSICFASY